jgi:hypothetical protein
MQNNSCTVRILVFDHASVNRRSAVPTLTRPANVPRRNKEAVGAYSKEHREALGLTQNELVARMGEDF